MKNTFLTAFANATASLKKTQLFCCYKPKKGIKTFLWFSVAMFFISEHFAHARPEYAARIRTNRCTTCHVNPTGGGHRNLTGKAFGPKAHPLKSFSQQDLFAVDLRSIAYAQLKNTAESKNGLGVMAAIPSVSIPFHATDKGIKWRLNYAQNIGGFGGFTTPRDAHLSVQLYDGYKAYPQFITAGRFIAPFGLLTDEHRTYVRWKTRTSWNDYEMGLLFSGDWTPALHYDLSIVNGEQSQGNFATGRILDWGSILNLRYMSINLGWIAGVSASAHNIKACAQDTKQCIAALSLYQTLSLDGLTNNWIPGSLLLEAVIGYNTNHRLSGDFVSKPKYLELVGQKYSLGGRARWNYRFLPDWLFITKYDYLTLDLDYWGDAYHRLGFGIKHFFNNQVQLEARYEKAIVTPLSEISAEQPGKGKQDVVWALLQVKL